MANNPIDWSLLGQSLERDLTVSKQLLHLLELERLALQERQYQRFDEQLKEKQVLITSMERGATARRQWLAKHGFADDISALRQVRQQDTKVAALWQAAADVWHACQRASTINEQICNRTRTVVDRVLDILHGRTNQGATYDAKGLTRRLPAGRNITSA